MLASGATRSAEASTGPQSSCRRANSSRLMDEMAVSVASICSVNRTWWRTTSASSAGTYSSRRSEPGSQLAHREAAHIGVCVHWPVVLCTNQIQDYSSLTTPSTHLDIGRLLLERFHQRGQLDQDLNGHWSFRSRLAQTGPGNWQPDRAEWPALTDVQAAFR